jgi:hypothetical protein
VSRTFLSGMPHRSVSRSQRSVRDTTCARNYTDLGYTPLAACLSSQFELRGVREASPARQFVLCPKYGGLIISTTRNVVRVIIRFKEMLLYCTSSTQKLLNN